MTAPRSFNQEPKGPTEFSWGRGIQAPPSEGAVPSTAEQHRALLAAGRKGRSEDPGATADAAMLEDYVREP